MSHFALYVPKFLKVLKKSRSLAVLFRPVPEGVVLLHGYSKAEHSLSISPPRSISVGQSALGWHAVCYLTSPYKGPDVNHRFSNAIGEPRHLWYDLQLTTGFGSLRSVWQWVLISVLTSSDVGLFFFDGKLPEFGLQIFLPPSLGPTQMVRGSIGAMSLAAAHPFHIVPRNLSFWIWWVSGV